MICFAILAHNQRPCLDDLIANLRALASPCRILVYNGGSDPHFLDGLDVSFPYSHPITYDRSTYLLEVMEWLLDEGPAFDYLINLDSDMLLIKPGLEQYLDRTMGSAEYWGPNLSISPVGASRWTNERGFVREYEELWLPLLGDWTIGRAFNPGQVLRRSAVEKIRSFLSSPRRAALARLIAQTQAFALDEVLIPSLACHAGCVCQPWPHSNTRLTLRRFAALAWHRRAVQADMIHDLLAGERGGLRYKEAFNGREVRRFLQDDHTFLIHPVRMCLDDPVRRLIRTEAARRTNNLRTTCPGSDGGARLVAKTAGAGLMAKTAGAGLMARNAGPGLVAKNAGGAETSTSTAQVVAGPGGGTPADVDVSVVILTWNSLSTIPSCLASLYQLTRGVSFEVIVVDNGSGDGTPAWIRQHYPEVQLVENRMNRGVAPARNQGLRRARGKACCLLDSDTILLNDALTVLYARLWSEPGIGLVAPRLEYRDGTHQVNCRRFPTVLTKLGRMLGKDAASPGAWGRLLRQEQQIGPETTAATDVDYAIGACQMFRRSVLGWADHGGDTGDGVGRAGGVVSRRGDVGNGDGVGRGDGVVGYLDEHIFYGPEDVDFCLRLWLQGWRVVYEPAARLVHDEQRLSHKKLFSRTTRAHLAGLAYYFWKHRYGLSRQRLYRRILPRSAAKSAAPTPPSASTPR